MTEPTIRRTYGPLKLSPGCDRYGASMGRRTIAPAAAPGERLKLHLRRVRIDNGGYDAGGAYWGFGAPLYQVSGETAAEVIEYYIRAADRDHAKEIVQLRYPEASFYR